VGTTFTITQRAEREEEVRKMLKKGKTQREIASALGVTTQAISKFLKVRGWTTQIKE